MMDYIFFLLSVNSQSKGIHGIFGSLIFQDIMNVSWTQPKPVSDGDGIETCLDSELSLLLRCSDFKLIT